MSSAIAKNKRPTRHDTVLLHTDEDKIFENINHQFNDYRERLARLGQKDAIDTTLNLIDLNTDFTKSISDINQSFIKLNNVQQMLAQQVKIASASKQQLLNELQQRVRRTQDDLRLLVIPFFDQKINQKRTKLNILLKKAAAVMGQLSAEDSTSTKTLNLQKDYLSMLEQATELANKTMLFIQTVKIELNSSLFTAAYFPDFMNNTETLLQTQLEHTQALRDQGKQSLHKLQQNIRIVQPPENSQAHNTSIFHHAHQEITGTAVHLMKSLLQLTLINIKFMLLIMQKLIY